MLDFDFSDKVNLESQKLLTADQIFLDLELGLNTYFFTIRWLCATFLSQAPDPNYWGVLTLFALGLQNIH